MGRPRSPLFSFVQTVGAVIFFSATFGLGNRSQGESLPLAPSLTDYASPLGQQFLLESTAKADFWELSANFLTQITQSYCGVASSGMVLNSLDLQAPDDERYRPYRMFTQDNFFADSATQAVLPAEVVLRQGMTLSQLGQLLASHETQVKVVHAGDISLAEFREQVVANLTQPNNYVLVNYLRREMEQQTGGHISPIAAYHAASDRFLILDVARYKYPPVWVKAEDLWRAINTVDSVSGKTRGFVLVDNPSRDN